MNEIEIYDSAQAAGEAAAAAIAGALGGAGPRTFVATGGRTPGPAYDALSKMDLHWGEITITQTDERFVGPRDEDSNEKLLRERLLTGEAAGATLVGLKAQGPTPQADADVAERKLRAILPSAAVLLGVGDDGHIASIFPKDPDLAAHMDPSGEALCFGTDVADDPPHVARISLTARALLDTGLIAILVSGAGKRALLQRVLDDPGYAPPCAVILRQDRVPIRIFWSP